GLAASLRTASDIQAAMLPGDFATLGAVAGVEIHAKLLPAREVGGDLYDVFPLSDGHLCLLVGDVSDKGVPAALLMAMTQTAIRAAAERSVEGGGPPGPSEILAEANRMLCRNNPQAMFVTLFLAIWDASNHRLRYANAGHNPPRRYRTGESWEPLSVQANIALGVLPDQAFGTEETRLDAGEALLLYTDGITEAMNPAGAAYGVRRLDAALAASDRRHPSRVVNNVLADAARFSDGAPQSDDMTCLAMVVA
ncbi:MAG: PP2C family protein-serine/threonine phosphatase, partial [Pseudomonadota bacterium]